MKDKSSYLSIFFFGFIILATCAAGIEKNESNVSIGSYFEDENLLWLENTGASNFTGSLLFWDQTKIPIIDSPTKIQGIKIAHNSELYITAPEGFENGWYVSLKNETSEEVDSRRFNLN